MINITCFWPFGAILGPIWHTKRYLVNLQKFWDLGSPPPHGGKNSQIISFFLFDSVPYDWLTSTFFPLVLTIHKNLNQSKDLGTNPSFVGHKVKSTYQNSEDLQISNPSIPAQLSSFDRETHCVICPPWWKMCFVEGHSDKREAAFRKRPVCIFYFSAFFVFSERDHSFSALFVFLVRAYSALLLYLYFYLISFTFSYYYLSLCCQKRLIHIFHFLPEPQFPLPTFWQHI